MKTIGERIEGLGHNIVPLCYMVSLIGGTAYYFTDGAGSLGKYVFFIGVALAIATEMHSFLLQRRILAAWQRIRRNKDGQAVEAAWFDVKFYGGWLVALLAFQIFCAIMYRVENWHPTNAFVAAWFQILIAGFVVPLFFFGMSFLGHTPLDPEEVQEQTASYTAMQSAKAGQKISMQALEAAKRSFFKRLKKAEKANKDLTGLAISMQRRFGDDDGAHTLMVIDNELRAVEGNKSRAYAGIWKSPDDGPDATEVPGDVANGRAVYITRGRQGQAVS